MLVTAFLPPLAASSELNGAATAIASKNPSTFEGVPVWVSLVPKVYFGVKTMCKKFHKFPTLGCNLLSVTVLTIFTQARNAVTAVIGGFEDYDVWNGDNEARVHLFNSSKGRE